MRRPLILLLALTALLTGCVTSHKPKPVHVSAREQSVVIEDPQVYNHLFQQIQRAVFIRQGLTQPPTP